MKPSSVGTALQRARLRGSPLAAAFVSILFAMVLAGCGESDPVASRPANGAAADQPADPSVKGAEIDATSCAWPLHTDGRESGFGFNDRNAAYSAQPMFTDLPGGHWRFHAQYPKARWISFESYNDFINSQDWISGTHIDPDDKRLTSKFAPQGTAQPGDWFTVDLINLPPSKREKNPHNIIYGGYRHSVEQGEYQHSNIQSVIYRVYNATPDVDTLGGFGRPRLVWVVDDPATNPFRDSVTACASLSAAYAAYQPWTSIIISLEELNKPFIAPILVPIARQIQGSPDTHNPPYMNIFRPTDNGYSNLYFNSLTPYVGFNPNTFVGPLVVVRFKAPTFTKIHEGRKPTGGEQVAYWDWCSTQFLTPLNYTIACRRDEQFTIDRDGYATLVVSTDEARPVINGQPYADWLPMAGDDGLTVMRQLEPNPLTFPESMYFFPPAVPVDTDLLLGAVYDEAFRKHMGSYYPELKYCTKAEFEKDRCATAAVPSGGVPGLPAVPASGGAPGLPSLPSGL